MVVLDAAISMFRRFDVSFSDSGLSSQMLIPRHSLGNEYCTLLQKWTQDNGRITTGREMSYMTEIRAQEVYKLVARCGGDVTE
jgi:uncharacterized protein YfaT (DUF1175 family)